MKKTLRVRELLPRALDSISSIGPRATSGNGASNRFRLARSITTPPYTRRTSTCVLPSRPVSAVKRPSPLLSFKQMRSCSARRAPKIQIIELSCELKREHRTKGRFGPR